MPKPVSDQLFLLIHSMNEAEKRYFKRFLLLYGGKESACGKLFDAFAKQTVYDEAALKRAATYLPGFAQHKKRLGELLLRSLRAYHADATAGLRIKAHLMDSEIFRQKRMYTAGISALKKAAKLAKKIQDPLAELEALGRSDALVFDARQPGRFSDHRATMTMEKTLLAGYAELVQHKSIAKQEYHRHYFEKKPQRAPAKKNAANEKPQLPENVHALRYYLLSQTAVELGNGRTKAAYRYAKQHVQLLNRHEWLIRDHPYEYVKALSTQLVLEDIQQLHTESTATIARMRELHRQPALAKKLKLFESHTFTYTYTTELNMLVRRGAYTEAIGLIPAITKGLERHGKKITAGERKVFHYNFSLLHFYTGNAKQAFRSATQALNIDHSIRADFNYTLYLLRMLATFERNDVDFFGVLVKKEGIRLLESGIAPKFTRELMKFFAVLGACATGKEIKNTCSVFREQLKTPALRKEIKSVGTDFDIGAWLEARLTGRKMAEVMLVGSQ